MKVRMEIERQYKADAELRAREKRTRGRINHDIGVWVRSMQQLLDDRLKELWAQYMVKNVLTAKDSAARKQCFKEILQRDVQLKELKALEPLKTEDRVAAPFILTTRDKALLEFAERAGLDPLPPVPF